MSKSIFEEEIKDSFEGRGEFLFFQEERALFEAFCCYMHFLQV